MFPIGEYVMAAHTDDRLLEAAMQRRLLQPVKRRARRWSRTARPPVPSPCAVPGC